MGIQVSAHRMPAAAWPRSAAVVLMLLHVVGSHNVFNELTHDSVRRLSSGQRYTFTVEPGYQTYLQLTAPQDHSIAVAIVPCSGRLDFWARLHRASLGNAVARKRKSSDIYFRYFHLMREFIEKGRRFSFSFPSFGKDPNTLQLDASTATVTVANPYNDLAQFEVIMLASNAAVKHSLLDLDKLFWPNMIIYKKPKLPSDGSSSAQKTFESVFPFSPRRPWIKQVFAASRPAVVVAWETDPGELYAVYSSSGTQHPPVVYTTACGLAAAAGPVSKSSNAPVLQET